MVERDGVSRRGFLASAATGLAAAGAAPRQAAAAPLFPSLANVGETFSVALVADPQVEGRHTKSPVARTSQEKLSRIVREINALSPAPAFVLFDGDLVNSPIPVQIENFIERARGLRPPVILVHGNHDGRPPYDEFKRMQRALNGTEAVTFSFDCGAWHFVSFPCNLPRDQTHDELLDWLDADLSAAGDKPVMVFEHLHLMPQGLTQLEWYTYDKDFRIRLLGMLKRHPRVRYLINGHVHNGIQASVKTAWTYAGMNFLTAPTCTASRNFGEEFPAFAAGQVQSRDDTGGGYYLLLDFDRENVRVRGRLAGCAEEYLFPDRFREYQGQEPLWMANLFDHPIQASLANGSFEEKLSGWLMPYRYRTEKDPGFIGEIRPRPDASSGSCLYLYCRDKGEPWAHDERMEAYQTVRLPPGESPTVSAQFYLDAPPRRGCGYLQILGFKEESLEVLVLVDWGDGDRGDNRWMGNNTIYQATGRPGSPTSLAEMGQRKRALFWTIDPSPGKWHALSIAVGEALDRALGRPGAYRSLGIDRLLIAPGCWCQKDPDSRAGASFDDLRVEAPGEGKTSFDGADLPIGAENFQTLYGRTTLERRREERPRRPSGKRA